MLVILLWFSRIALFPLTMHWIEFMSFGAAISFVFHEMNTLSWKFLLSDGWRPVTPRMSSKNSLTTPYSKCSIIPACEFGRNGTIKYSNLLRSVRLHAVLSVICWMCRDESSNIECHFHMFRGKLLFCKCGVRFIDRRAVDNSEKALIKLSALLLQAESKLLQMCSLDLKK